jgi:manganese transport system permease protein
MSVPTAPEASITVSAVFAVVYLFSPRQGLIGTRLAKLRRQRTAALAA